MLKGVSDIFLNSCKSQVLVIETAIKLNYFRSKKFPTIISLTISLYNLKCLIVFSISYNKFLPFDFILSASKSFSFSSSSSSIWVSTGSNSSSFFSPFSNSEFSSFSFSRISRALDSATANAARNAVDASLSLPSFLNNADEPSLSRPSFLNNVDEMSFLNNVDETSFLNAVEASDLLSSLLDEGVGETENEKW